MIIIILSMIILKIQLLNQIRTHTHTQFTKTAIKKIMSQSSFKFQLLSDIHLEFMMPSPISGIPNDDPRIQKEVEEAIQEDELLKNFFDKEKNHATAPYLALLGDIGLASSSPDFFGLQLFPFLKVCCQKYKDVFFVSGNHESYSGSIKQTNANLTQLEKELPNFHYLNRKTFDVKLDSEGEENDKKVVRILGTTLWTNCDPKARHVLNDFRQIKKFGVDDMQELHQGDVAFLQEELTRAEEENIPCVVFTHHVPLLGGFAIPNSEEEIEIENRYKITGTDLIPKVFDGKKQFAKSLKAWCWGHSHHNLPNHVMEIEGVKCMTNQYGYPEDPYKKMKDYQKAEIAKVFEVAP